MENLELNPNEQERIKESRRENEKVNLENVEKAKQNRNVSNNQNLSGISTNLTFSLAFFREQIGKVMRIEFLIGTNNLVEKLGILQDVGESYILLRSIENDSLVYCDIYSIKFITVSTTSSIYGVMNGINAMNGMNWMGGNSMMNGSNGANWMENNSDFGCMNNGRYNYY